MGVLLGIDMQGFERPEGSDELPPGLQKSAPEPSASRPSASSAPPKSTRPEPETKDAEMAEPEEEDEDAKAKKAAEAEKQKGGAAYKARDFTTAAEHYQKAWDLWPKDITYLTNLAGA